MNNVTNSIFSADLHSLTLEQLEQLETEIAAERSRRSGQPLLLVDEGTVIMDPPNGGWISDVYFCTDRGHTVEWYPTEEAAMAALHALAKAHHRVVDDRKVDLTVAGCLESYASVARAE